MAFITAETRSSIVELAMGMLNQAPSTGLLTTLIGKSTEGASLQDLADYIATTDAFTAEYPATQTAREFATEMFGKLITGGTLDAEVNTAVMDLLEGLLIAGTTKAQGFVAVIDFLSNSANASHPDLGDIAQSFQNRADAAEYFSITKELGGSTDAELAAAIASVTSDAATLTAANAAADTAASAVAAVAGETFTLTAGLDNKTLGAGDDQVFGISSDTAADNTFISSDAINGGAGIDTLFVTLQGVASDGEFTPSRITNFEKLSLTNIDGAEALDFDVDLMGDLTGIEISASTGAVSVDNVPAAAEITLTGNTAAIDVNLENADLSGTEDSVTINMTSNTGQVSVLSDGVLDIEKVTFNVSGVNSGDIEVGDSGATSTVTSITVTGAGTIDLEGGALNTVVETLDASANTGGVTFDANVATGTSLTGGSGNDDLQGAGGNDTIMGGAGDDTLRMGSGGEDHLDGGAGNDTVYAGGATKLDTITGGDGVDTLVLDSALSYDAEAATPVNDAANISGFEILSNAGSITQDMTPLTGITTVVAAAGVATLTEAAVTTFAAMASSSGLDLTLATDGTDDNLTISVGVATAAAQSAVTGVLIDAIEIETATISSVGADTNTITDFEADALKTLTIVGSKALEVTLNDSTAATAIALTTVNASAFTGSDLHVIADSADSGVTLTTGSAALTATLGEGADHVTGTSGNDSITVNDGADTVVSGDGDDEVSLGDGANVLTSGDGNSEIDGGEGVDTITVGDGNNDIATGDGADVVVGGLGNNTVRNAAGNDTITLGDGNNSVTNTAGNSTITLGDGDNEVTLTAGNSTVVTGSGADDIDITAGNNNITAGAGNDSISLGSGNDTVDGGTGTDSADFSKSSGTWAGTISDVEAVTATFGGTATINLENVSGYDSLTVTANATVSTATIKNLASSTLILTEDNVEGGGDGEFSTVSIDTVDDAALVLNLKTNQEAAEAGTSDLGGLTITDAASVSVTTSGGEFGVAADLTASSIALDDDETTSLSLDTSNYATLKTGNITGSESLQSVTITADGAEADVEVGTLADAANLNSVSISATGLNADVEVEEIGATSAASLDTVSITASNGADVDTTGEADGTEFDIETLQDMTSFIVSADGAGTNNTVGQLHAEDLEVGTVSFSATDEGTIDLETSAYTSNLDYGFNTLTLETSGTGSTIAADGLTQDSESLAAADEASIYIDASGASSTVNLDDSTLGGVLLDVVDINVGAYATLSMAGDGADVGTDEGISDEVSSITATGDIGSLSIVVEENGTFNFDDPDLANDTTDAVDTLTIAAENIGTFTYNIGDSEAIDGGLLLDVEGDSAETGAEPTIQTIHITMADMGNETDFNADSEDLLRLDSSTVFLEVSAGATESDVGHFYNGSVTLLGDEDNSIDLTGGVVDAADLATAGTEGTWGAWTLTTGSGADAIVSVGGSDTITPGLGQDTVTGNGGGDSIVLTEAVSSADTVVYAAVTDGSEVGEDEGTFTDYDVITGFVSGVDTIDNNISLGNQEVVVAGSAATGTTNDLTSANYKDMDSVFAFISDSAVEDLVESDGVYDASSAYTFGVTISGVGTVVYAINNDATAAVAITEIYLLGTVDATLVAGDFS